MTTTDYTITTSNIPDKTKELSKAVLKSNLSDDDKVEIIARLNNNNIQYVPYQPYTPDTDKITWILSYKPTKDHYENAKGDNVMNHQTYYCW